MKVNQRYIDAGIVLLFVGATCILLAVLVPRKAWEHNFRAAIKRGDDDLARQMVADGKADQPFYQHGRVSSYPLHIAAQHGNPNVVAMLLEAGADPNCRDLLGATPALAVFYSLPTNSNHLKCLDVLVQFGADLDASNDKGANALCWASMNGDAEGVRRLLELGASVNPDTTSSPLRSAVVRNRDASVDVVNALIEYGADVNAVDTEGKRAIDYAAEGGHAEIVAILKAAAAKAESESAE